MDLHALEDFNLVARHGGFGRAAKAARRPKATLSRRVADLEAELGVRLFERNARRAVLTEEGRALHKRTSSLLAEIADVADAIASGDNRPRGLLRISAPVLFSHMALGRLVADFAIRHPDVRVDVVAEDRNADPVDDGFDLVIRVNPTPDQTLVGRKFMRDHLIVAAAPSVACPAVDGEVRAVALGSLAAGPWRFEHGGTMRTLLPAPVVCLSTFPMVRDALRRGVGAGLLPFSLALPDLRDGKLVDWGRAEGRDVELWVLYTTRRLLSRKVIAFLDHLYDAFPTGAPDELSSFLR